MSEQISEDSNNQEPPKSPYVGLIPFTEEHEKYFFGRKRDIEVTASNLRAIRLTIFYGTSGVGKSSLINAGVIPYLRKIAAVSKTPKGSPEFILVVLRDWANDPLAGLRREIADAIRIAVEEKQIPDVKLHVFESVKKINEKTGNLTEIIKNWTKLTKTRLLIILDQFEDFFLRSDFATGENSFGEEFPKIVNSCHLPVNFIISMRDDAIAKLDFFQGRIPNLLENTLRLSHLDRQSTKEAIREPLREYEKATGSKFEIKDDLVEKLLDDTKIGNIKFETQEQAVANAAGGPPNGTTSSENYQSETPYLQLVLMKLWEDDTTQSTKTLALKTLEEKGGVGGIVKSHLDEVMRQFSDNEKKLISKFIRFTITRSGAKNTFSVKDIVFWTQDDEEKFIEDILRKLSEGNARIFKTVQNFSDQNTPFYQVAHDALGPAILNWSREFNTEKVRRETEEAKQKEIEKEKEEKEEQIAKLKDEQEKLVYQERMFDAERRSRRLGRYAFVLSILLLAISFSAIAFFLKNYLKERNREISEIKALSSDAFEYKTLLDILKDLQSNEPEIVSDALNSLDAKMTDKDFPEEYKSLFEESLRRISEKQIQKTGTETALDAIRENANTSLKIIEDYKSSPKAAAYSPLKLIYIQVQNSAQKENALKIRNALDQENNFIAPGVENAGLRKKIIDNELRYFHSEDSDSVEEVRAFLEQKGIKAALKLMPGYQKRVRRNQFELWFNNEPIPNIEQLANSQIPAS